MLHIVGNLLTGTTTLLETSPQLEVCIKSYGFPKWWEFQFWEFQDFQFGSFEKNDISVQPPWIIIENIIRGKVVTSCKSGLW